MLLIFEIFQFTIKTGPQIKTIMKNFVFWVMACEGFLGVPLEYIR